MVLLEQKATKETKSTEYSTFFVFFVVFCDLHSLWVRYPEAGFGLVGCRSGFTPRWFVGIAA